MIGWPRRTLLLTLLAAAVAGPAAAEPAPVVTLFGPTHIAWTETYFPGAVHVQKQVPCGPCQQRVCPLDHHRPLVDIVLQSVADFLRRTGLGLDAEIERALLQLGHVEDLA